MILPDVNLLIYAVNKRADRHTAARRWLEDVLSGTTELGLAWIVALGFLRITTRPAVLERPLTCEQALAYLNEWLSQPFASLVVPGNRHWEIFSNLLLATGTGGNLTSDTHLAALALENGAEIHSADHDFKRFPGIVHVNPL